ncbi:hypothetical protein [Oceanobacillus neutriphilus]|uniref:Uncharacterized protein n=1 Tax=Oceanobacillus neutriphilus TaxID=531815 RepID=A0ABQ2NZF6_9BACI|nr:hypothetical protein [Oceanobacillus neutriphilus]GGP14399.1 hypothetical protein GCM10011346_38200 [Oceanobacillus neutriphilus]
MKRWYVVIAAAVLLAGCGNREEEVIEPAGPEDSVETENQTTDAVTFQEIDVTAEGEQFHIIGQVKTSADVFFYRIEQDGEVIQEEESVRLEGEDPEAFRSFGIMETFSGDILEHEEPPIVIMYGKNKDNKEINANFVPIDTEQ